METNADKQLGVNRNTVNGMKLAKLLARMDLIFCVLNILCKASLIA